MEYTLNLGALNDIGSPEPKPNPLPKMQGIVSDMDLTLPTETRKERITRQKAEADALKAQAKATKGQPVTKPKVSLVSADQTVTYIPDKKPFVLIDIPKLGRNLKKLFKNKLVPSIMIMGAVLLFATIAIFNLLDNPTPTDTAKEKAVEHTTVTKAPAVNTPAPAKVETPVVPEPVVEPKSPASPSTTTSTQEDHSITPSAYLVASGDTLWDIAENVYGDGSRWTEIYELNKEYINAMDSRNAVDPGHWIHEGITLQLE